MEYEHLSNLFRIIDYNKDLQENKIVRSVCSMHNESFIRYDNKW